MKRRKKGKGILIMLTCIFFSLLTDFQPDFHIIPGFLLLCVETIITDVQVFTLKRGSQKAAFQTSNSREVKPPVSGCRQIPTQRLTVSYSMPRNKHHLTKHKVCDHTPLSRYDHRHCFVA